MYSDIRTGLPLLLSHLATLCGALLLLLTHVAIGARVRALLGARGPAAAAWRWPVDATLGAGVLALPSWLRRRTRRRAPAGERARDHRAARRRVVREWIAVARELGARMMPARETAATAGGDALVARLGADAARVSPSSSSRSSPAPSRRPPSGTR